MRDIRSNAHSFFVEKKHKSYTEHHCILLARVGGRDVAWMLRRMIEQASEWQSPTVVTDCDVAAAFDDVSHQEIIKATLDIGVPPVLIAAWIGEHREFGNCCEVG